MNRGVLETSPAVQQLMTTGNPNWWSMNGGGGGGNMMRPPTHPPATAPPQNISSFLQPPQLLPSFLPQFLPSPTSSSSSSSPSLPKPNHNNNIPSWLDSHELPPESWSLSQLLLGGLMVGDEERMGLTHESIQGKKLENWEEQVLLSRHRRNQASSVVDVKQENCGYNLYGYHNHQIMPNSPPNKSCVTTISTISSSTNSMLDFSSSLSNGNNNNTNNNCNKGDGRHPPPDRSSECNSSETGGSVKKPRLQPPPSTQSTLKVRKEKLGGRIAALHQLVSPFGKTDTASVLSEAIGYIRFLQSQIEALSLPYFGTPSGNMRQQQHVQGGRNCVFTEDTDQFGGENHQNPNYEEPMKDLRSRGLCLVPISCTLQVGSDNGADYWAPALGPTGFP